MGRKARATGLVAECEKQGLLGHPGDPDAGGGPRRPADTWVQTETNGPDQAWDFAATWPLVAVPRAIADDLLDDYARRKDEIQETATR